MVLRAPIGLNCRSVLSLRSQVEHFSYRCFSLSPTRELPSIDIFREHLDDELPGPSSEDYIFLEKLTANVKIIDSGHIEISLPFHADKPIMPNNQKDVYCRSRSTVHLIVSNEMKPNYNLV